MILLVIIRKYRVKYRGIAIGIGSTSTVSVCIQKLSFKVIFCNNYLHVAILYIVDVDKILSSVYLKLDTASEYYDFIFRSYFLKYIFQLSLHLY